MENKKIHMRSEEIYKAKYFILSEGIKRIVRALKKDIYEDRIPPTALKHMSDLKFYLMCAEYQSRMSPVRNVRVKKIKGNPANQEDFILWCSPKDKSK